MNAPRTCWTTASRAVAWRQWQQNWSVGVAGLSVPDHAGVHAIGRAYRRAEKFSSPPVSGRAGSRDDQIQAEADDEPGSKHAQPGKRRAGGGVRTRCAAVARAVDLRLRAGGQPDEEDDGQGGGSRDERNRGQRRPVDVHDKPSRGQAAMSAATSAAAGRGRSLTLAAVTALRRDAT